MEVGAAVAGVAAGAQALFGYNRENFKYDREMRQKSEYQVLGWRGRQAELWRDDVREIIGLTEKKMDNYLIISTLQLGMCVGLFTEGLSPRRLCRPNPRLSTKVSSTSSRAASSLLSAGKPILLRPSMPARVQLSGNGGCQAASHG